MTISTNFTSNECLNSGNTPPTRATRSHPPTIFHLTKQPDITLTEGIVGLLAKQASMTTGVLVKGRVGNEFMAAGFPDECGPIVIQPLIRREGDLDDSN
ncbi:hypothetical protein V8E54_001327 [Elaphomyces granulatus]